MAFTPMLPLTAIMIAPLFRNWPIKHRLQLDGPDYLTHLQRRKHAPRRQMVHYDNVQVRILLPQQHQCVRRLRAFWANKVNVGCHGLPAINSLSVHSVFILSYLSILEFNIIKFLTCYPCVIDRQRSTLASLLQHSSRNNHPNGIKVG